jgi:hypothetical protein
MVTVTMHLIRHESILMCLALWCCAAWAQESPAVAGVVELSRNPAKYDGRLVSVRAWLEIGWEGDNFLVDHSEPSRHDTARPRVWLYCDPEYNRQVCGEAYNRYKRPVLATFTGYFHFVPDKKVRMKDVFDPGPLQLQAIRISDVVRRAP